MILLYLIASHLLASALGLYCGYRMGWNDAMDEEDERVERAIYGGGE